MSKSVISPRYRHREVAESLRKEILRQRQVGNRQLLSERDLADQHSCSRATVRRALAELYEAGLIARVPGKGTVILQSGVDDSNSGVEGGKSFTILLSIENSRSFKSAGR